MKEITELIVGAGGVLGTLLVILKDYKLESAKNATDRPKTAKETIQDIDQKVDSLRKDFDKHINNRTTPLKADIAANRRDIQSLAQRTDKMDSKLENVSTDVAYIRGSIDLLIKQKEK